MRGKDEKITLEGMSSRITPAYAGKRMINPSVLDCIKDHPRLCGEKVFLAPLVLSVIRITPAYAGKSPALRPEFATEQDHPRLCGEKFSGTLTPKTDSGSPPPMRGKAGKSIDKRHKSRITPAYAGKSVIPYLILYSVADHPRLCGEKFSGIWENIKSVGSPPPMRGKETKDKKYWWQMRITPAYAGKSVHGFKKPFDQEDHPRLCGEKSLTLCTSYNRKGSPPPMRGKANDFYNRHCVLRITPAYAGKSLHELGHYLLGEDHPRLCGEKWKRGS